MPLGPARKQDLVADLGDAPRLTDLEIYKLARKHFGDLNDENAVTMAGAIALAESGGYPEAKLDNYPRWQRADSPYRWDRGLMQINSVHGFPVEDHWDPDKNMRMARWVYDRQGFKAWSVVSGAGLPPGTPAPYLRYVPNMIAAAQQWQEEQVDEISEFNRGRADMFWGLMRHLREEHGLVGQVIAELLERTLVASWWIPPKQ